MGDTITLRCEILVSTGCAGELTSATIARDGDRIRSDTPNHMLLTSGSNVVGVNVSNVNLNDNGIEYTCNATGAPPDFKSSLNLSITGTYVQVFMLTIYSE